MNISQELTTTININILLTSQNTQNVRNLSYVLPYSDAQRQVRINQAMDDTCQRGLNLQGAQIFHIDFANRMKVFLGTYPFSQEVRVGLESIVNGCIQLSYKSSSQSTQMVEESQERAQTQETQTRNRKVKERTIEEAIQSVKQWRYLYDSADQTGKRFYTLQEAARKVGIAKKTLDDYYVHLRVAYQFSFNLERFKSYKIGLLRKFVKIARDQGSQAVQQQMPECVLDCDTDKYWVDFDSI